MHDTLWPTVAEWHIKFVDEDKTKGFTGFKHEFKVVDGVVVDVDDDSTRFISIDEVTKDITIAVHYDGSLCGSHLVSSSPKVSSSPGHLWEPRYTQTPSH